MERPKETARFGSIVADRGMPEVVTLWTAPEVNRDFAKAIRQNRVLTVRQENVGSRKDYGIVGFYPGGSVSFLVFPKGLTRYAGKRIVGIHYDALAAGPGARAGKKKRDVSGSGGSPLHRLRRQTD